jgi:hypothetical protein
MMCALYSEVKGERTEFMLAMAHHETDGHAGQSFVSRDGVGGDLFVRGPKMGPVVEEVDGL